MTTVDTGTGEILTSLDDEALLAGYQEADAWANQFTTQRDQFKHEIHKRLRDSGAKKLYGKGLEYKDETKPEPNRSRIPPLMEYLTPAEIKKCLTKGHYPEPVWVEDKYDLAKVKQAIKDHGGEAQEALDSIYMPGAAGGRLITTG